MCMLNERRNRTAMRAAPLVRASGVTPFGAGNKKQMSLEKRFRTPDYHGTVEIHALELVDDFHEFTFRLADNLYCPLLFVLLTASSLRTPFSKALFELDVSTDGR